MLKVECKEYRKNSEGNLEATWKVGQSMGDCRGFNCKLGPDEQEAMHLNKTL